MISVIVSSYKEDFFVQFQESINNTIGIDYEIIKIPNPNSMGICEAYNIGSLKAKYEILLFCHEDVLFKNNNWGKELLSVFENDEKVGLIGLAGSKVKSAVASGWHTSQERFLAYNFYQSNYKLDSEVLLCKNIDEITEVAVIDGFFMATKKSIILKNPFDSDLLKGFHAYDLDISLAISQRHKVVVTDKVKVEHLSLGNPDKKWFYDILKINDKYATILPLYTNKIKKSKTLEYENLKFLIYYINKNDITKPNAGQLIKKYSKNIGLYNCVKIIIYFLFNKFLR